VLLFTAAVTALAGLLAGLAPALGAARLDIHGVLREGQGTLAAGRGRARLQGALVAAQFALALVVADGAGLMVRSYLNAAGMPAGVDAERTLTAGITLEGTAYRGKPAAQAAFWQRLLDEVRTIPGVEAAGATTKLPLEGGNNGSYLVEDEQYDPKANRPVIERSWVTPEYFEAAGVPVLAGRLFETGSATEARAEIVVNRAFVRQYFPDGNALGKRIYPNSAARDWVGVIVGVAEDVRQWTLELPAVPEVYQPFESTGRANRFLIVRAGVPPMALERAVREAVSRVDREQPVADIRAMEAVVDGSTAKRRFSARLTAVFAMLGLLLAAAGVYGVISCWVEQRRREVGIRMALGASRGRILGMVARRGAMFAGAGIGLGTAGALALTRIVKSLLYGVSPGDPASLAGAAALLAGVVLAGCALPALRAASIDPVRTLRAE
jgi:predicted permease